MSALLSRHQHKSALGAFMLMTFSLFAGPQEDFLAAMKRDNLKQAQKLQAAGGIDLNVADDKGKNAVQYACENGNAPAFLWLAEQQADIRSKDAEGNTCLHLALKARRPAAILAAAIEKGLDKNAVNSKGETPLMAAVAQGKKPVLDELIKLQADINMRNGEGYTPLSRSIANRRYDISNALLAAGAGPNAEQFAPLVLAYDAGNYKLFEALIKAGANTNINHEKSGQLLLLEAVKKERIAFAKLLIESGANIQIADANGESLPVLCAKLTIPDLVPVLVQKGLSVETKDAYGKTLLQIAHENILKRLTPARDKLFRVLLENGANPNTLSPTGRAILMEQAENGRYYQVKDLLDKGADVNFRDKSNNTVLHTTAQRNQLGTMKLVAEKFPDINITGDSGNTALHFAARAGGTGILKLLKDKGANLELKNNAGDTALAIAIGRQDPATTRALIALGASLGDEGRETPLMMEIAKSGAVNGKTLELLSVLQKAGAAINATNRYGNNALSYALNRKNMKMADAFLRAGAKSEAGDLRGNTMLHKVALSSRYNKLKNQELADWIHMVLSYQHSDFQNSAGETALHLAAGKENNPDLEAAYQFFETLVNYSANVNVRDQQGRTAYDLARKVDWETIAAANLPAAQPVQNIAQQLQTPENDQLLRLTAANRDFYAVHQQGKLTRVLRFSDELELKSVREYPSVQAVVATADGVIIAGTRPGEIDGVADNKCRQGQNLVVYISALDSGLSPRWEQTWGKPGSCQRTSALALGHDAQGNTYVYAEFSGRRSVRRLNSAGSADATETARSDRTAELALLPDGNIALPAQNIYYSFETGKNTGRLTRARSWRTLALAPSGVRVLAGDFTRLSARRGVNLWAEDAEGKTLWSKNFAGEDNMTVEQVAAGDERICVAGKADGAVHAQPHSTPGKPTDYYVLCTNAQGTRVYTRMLPAAGLTLAEMRVNRQGAVVLAFRGGDRKNPDIVLVRIDKEGRVFR